jgi:hypothetical protein
MGLLLGNMGIFGFLCIRQYIADCGFVDEFGCIAIEKIRSDAGNQFTSMEFQVFCRDEHINLLLAAPKKQAQNHLPYIMQVQCSTFSL